MGVSGNDKPILALLALRDLASDFQHAAGEVLNVAGFSFLPAPGVLMAILGNNRVPLSTPGSLRRVDLLLHQGPPSRRSWEATAL